jgi:hypothetical protein
MAHIVLDAPTALALTGIIAATLGALILLSWTQGRRDFYLALWGGGDILGGIAAGLFFGRGVLPDFLSINIGAALLALAYGVMFAAARDFSGKRTAPGWVSAGALLWLAACGFEPFYDFASSARRSDGDHILTLYCGERDRILARARRTPGLANAGGDIPRPPRRRMRLPRSDRAGRRFEFSAPRGRALVRRSGFRIFDPRAGDGDPRGLHGQRTR